MSRLAQYIKAAERDNTRRSYPLKLFQRVITVSIETMKLVRALPRLDIAVAVRMDVTL